MIKCMFKVDQILNGAFDHNFRITAMKMMRCNVMRCEYQSQRRTKVYWHTRQNAKMSPQLKSEKQSRASNFSTKTLVKSIIFRLNFAAHEGCRSRLMAREPLPLSAARAHIHTKRKKQRQRERAPNIDQDTISKASLFDYAYLSFYIIKCLITYGITLENIQHQN